MDKDPDPEPIQPSVQAPRNTFDAKMLQQAVSGYYFHRIVKNVNDIKYANVHPRNQAHYKPKNVLNSESGLILIQKNFI